MATQIGSYDFRAANQARQSIEIGGRNLLFNSYEIDLTDSLFEGTTVTVDTAAANKDNIKPYLLDNSATSNKRLIINFPTLIIGNQYTFSFDYLRAYTPINIIVNIDGETKTVATVNDDTWRRQFITFTATATSTTAIIYTNQSNRTIWVRKFQLEKGTIASDWKRAEEDVDEELFSIRGECPYIEQMNTGSDTWTGNAPTIRTLEDGQQIDFWHNTNWVGSGYVNTTNYWSQNGSALNLTLADGTTTGAIPIWFNGNTRLTSHYQSGTLIQMVYKENYLHPGYAESHRVAKGWYCKANYDSNSHDTISAVAATAGVNGVFPYSIVAQDTDATWTSLTTSGGNGTSKAYGTTAVNPSKMWFFNNGNIYANGATTGGNYYSDYYYVDMRYTLNISTSAFTARKNVYFKGTMTDDGKFKINASSPWTQTEPIADDEVYYWLIGIAYDGYRVLFTNSHPIYAYKYGSFQDISGLAVQETHRIYYRTATVNNSLTGPTTWVAEATGNIYNGWTTKVPPLSAKNGVASTDEDATKYLYLYTCEQRRLASNKIVCTKVLLDENTTIIDGGQIVTNSIAANKLTVYNATIGKIRSEYIDVGAIDITSTANYDDVETAIVNSASWFGTCATAAGTAVKVVNKADLVPASPAFPTTLRNGTTVQVKFSVANTAAVGSLQLNVASTGAKNIKYIYNNSIANLPAAGYLIAGIAYTFVYDGTYWVLQNLNYNTNDNYYDRMRLVQAVRIATGINYPQYAIGGRSFDTSKNGYIALSSGAQIDLSYPIAYLAQANASGQTYAVAGGSTTTNFYTSMNGVTLTYTKSGWSGTNYAMCYIKGELDGVVFTVHSDIFTTTAPTTDDGYVYIPIGMMYSTTAVKFQCNNDVYAYRNGKFGPLALQELLKTSSEISSQFKDVNGVLNDLQDGLSATNATYSHLIREVDGKVEIALIDDQTGQYVGYRTIQSANGSDVYEPTSSDSVAHYGASSRIGKIGDMHLELKTGRLAFVDGNGNAVAYMAIVDGQSVFKIEHSIIVQDLKFGNWQWWNRPNNNMALKWMGD